MDKDTRGRCVYCNSQAVNEAFICHNRYEKLMLIRKLRAIVFQIKVRRQWEITKARTKTNDITEMNNE